MSTMQLFLAPTNPDINAKMSTQTENHVNEIKDLNQAFTIDDKTIAALEQSLSSEITSEINNIDETILRNSSNNGNITENLHEDESLNNISGTVSKNFTNGSLCTENVDELEAQNLDEINKGEIINELIEPSTEKNIQHSESLKEQFETLTVLNATQPSFEDREVQILETNDVLKSDNSSSPNKLEDDENISGQNEGTKNVPNSSDVENSNNETEHVKAITTDTVYPDDVEMQEETNQLGEEPVNILLDNVSRELIVENVKESALLTDDDVPMHEVNQKVSEKLELESLKMDEDQLFPDTSNKSSLLGEIERVKPLEIDENDLLSVQNNINVTPVAYEAPPSPFEIDEEMSVVETIETKISLETDNIKKEDVVLLNENENITTETEDQEVPENESPSVQENITDCNTLLLEHSNPDKVQIVTVTEAEPMNNDESSSKITLDDSGEPEVSHESLTKTTEENNEIKNDNSEDNISMDIDDVETLVIEKVDFEKVTSDDRKISNSSQVDTIKTEVEILEYPQNIKNPTVSEETSIEKSELQDKTDTVISLKARAEKETESSNISPEEQEHSAGKVEESIDTTKNKTIISLKSGPEKESENSDVKEQEHIDITGNTNSYDDSVGEVEENIDTIIENKTVISLKPTPEKESENSDVSLKEQEHNDLTVNTNSNDDSMGEVDESVYTIENKTVISLKATPEKESENSNVSLKKQKQNDLTVNTNSNDDSMGEVDESVDTIENKTVISLKASPEKESVNSDVSLKEQEHNDITLNTNSNDGYMGEVEKNIDRIENKTVISLKATPEEESVNSDVSDVSLKEQEHIDITGNTNSNNDSVGEVEEIIDTTENKTVISLKATAEKESENSDVSLKEEEHIDITENTCENTNDDSVAEVEKSIDTTENKSSNEETMDNKKVEGVTKDDQDNVEIVDEDDVKIVELEPAEKQIKEKSPERDETKNLPVVCKLSNTLDILSDDEEEENAGLSTETSQTPKPEEKQCINLDDDDDIMLIEEDSNSKDKPDVSISKEETESKTNDKIDVETGEQNETNFSDSISKNNDKDAPEERTPNMDLDPETEAKTTSESEIKTAEPKKPLLPQNFLKTAKKNLANMTRHELEDFCILRIVESIVDRSNLSDIKSKMKTIAQSLDDFKKRATMLSKQNRDLQVVLKSLEEEQKKKTNAPVQPLKITRSVGMQVIMNDKLDSRRKIPIPNLAQPPPAAPIGKPVRAVQNVKQMKQPGSSANIPVPRKVPISNSPANKTNIHMNNVANKSASPSPNNIRNPSPVQKTPEKRTLSRMLSNSSSVTVDLTDDEPPSKISNKTSPSQPVRVVPPQNLMAPQRPFPPVNNARKVYIPISGPQAQQLRPGQTIIMKNIPQGPRPGLRAPMVPRAPGPQSPIRPKLGFTRHPAPLPESMKQYTPPNWKALPPAPDLKLSKVENGIVISWKIDGYPEGGYETIASYQLYAYQETTSPPSTALWKKIGDVKALPLPMACTLTQFMAGFKYYFAVRAVDIRSRIGPFSLPGSILLLNKV